MEPAAGLVKLAARRPARECMLGDGSGEPPLVGAGRLPFWVDLIYNSAFHMLGDWPLLPTRYSHRVPCCLPRPTSRRAYTIPGIARQWAWHQAAFMPVRMGTHSTPGCSRFPAAFEERLRIRVERQALILSFRLN